MKATHFHAGRHLDESELSLPTAECPLCREPSERRSILAIQASPRVELLACARCGGASASRMPRPEVLSAYYAAYYEGRGERVTCGSPPRFARAIARHLRPAPGDGPLRILDFGGGDGTLARATAKRLLVGMPGGRAEIRVVDYAPPPRSEEGAITLDGAASLDECPGRFDVVLASAVIEHVPDGYGVMRSLFERVAPGGSFYARTPYLAPFARFVPRLDLTFPAHVHDLGAPFWERVPGTFAIDARLVHSGPSPVEESFRDRPARAAVAALMKLPARLEGRIRGGRERAWRWVGGWEAVLRFADS